MLVDILIPITTDASGDSTDYPGDWPAIGYLECVLYDAGDFDTGADFTLSWDRYSVAETVLTVTNAGTADDIWYPRRAVDDNAAAAQTLADGDWTRFLILGRPKVVTAQGGNAKTGALIWVVEVPQ